jgi:oligoendopeptidase F
MTQHNWDLSKIYANDAARLEAKENIESQLAALHTLAGGGKDALPEILPAVFDLQRLFSSYYGYTMMSRDINTKDPSAQRMQQESDGMEARLHPE